MCQVLHCMLAEILLAKDIHKRLLCHDAIYEMRQIVSADLRATRSIRSI